MARTALSLLFACAILLSLAILSEAESVFRLVNAESEGWAKNFPPGAGRPPFETSVIIDDNFASIYERWAIDHFEEGYRIRNIGTGFWLTSRDEEVVGSSEFNPEDSKWYIERAGNEEYTIKLPNKDLVMTAHRGKRDEPITITLRPSEGENTQKWRLERLVEYSRPLLALPDLSADV
ncbi:hypothetical protein EC991_006885 [Linnemannia zychae]|nr:hypothetical protein EC991_006885 [Linnemannia zychae]